MKQDHLILCAFRYALGRCTYVVSEVAEHIMEHWDDINPHFQHLIKSEIKDAIEHGTAGMAMDVEVWQNLVEAVEMAEKMGKVDE